ALFANVWASTHTDYGVITVKRRHLLLSEPERGNPSVAIQVLKQRFSRRLMRDSRRVDSAQGCLWKEERTGIWQRRFYDFVVWTERKGIEKLRFMHRNPVKRGLV